MRKKSKKIHKKIIAGLFITGLVSVTVSLIKDNRSNFLLESQFPIKINYGGMQFKVLTSKASVMSVLQKEKIEIDDEDWIYPEKAQAVSPGMVINIVPAFDIKIKDAENTKEYIVHYSNVGEVLDEAGIRITEEDLVEPSLNEYIKEGDEIKITRVKIENLVEKVPIKFETKISIDEKLGWREEKTINKGKEGIKEIEYEVVIHNEEEISRKKISEKILEEPITRKIVKGGYIDIGKAHTGLGTWYAQPIHLEQSYPSITGYYAANPWLPKGSYVKVTNKANGKSIIARINDRGPFGENRIIDLGKNAFAAIASLGAGIIDVKMEEIKN